MHKGKKSPLKVTLCSIFNTTEERLSAALTQKRGKKDIKCRKSRRHRVKANTRPKDTRCLTKNFFAILCDIIQMTKKEKKEKEMERKQSDFAR